MSEVYKGYRITPLGTFPMVKIQSQSNGAAPIKLGGMYSTVVLAERAIDTYLSNLGGRKKVVNNGKQNRPTKSSSPTD